MDELKTYIGVKMIMAEPMNKEGKPGYRVVYPDGYASWSPKKAFEAAYLPLEHPTKITEGVVNAFLGSIEASQVDEKTTFVKANTLTGFRQYATSSCVDPENYDHELGKQIATGRVKDTLWLCLGFVLQWGRYGLGVSGTQKSN